MELENGYALEAEVRLPAIDVRVCRYRWPAGLRIRNDDDRNIISLSLSPLPPRSRAFLDMDTDGSHDGRYTDIGTVLFNPAGIPLHCLNDGGVQRLVICRFDNMFLPVQDFDLLDLRKGLDLRSPVLKATMRRLACEVLAPGFASAAMIEALVSTVVIDLSRTIGRLPYEERNRRQDSLAPWRLNRLREMVEGSEEGAMISVAEIADRLGLSPRHLTRAFKASAGSTLRDYIEDVNLDRAKRLLADPNVALKVLAVKLGFSSQSSFTVAFHRRCGETPASYRRRMCRSISLC